MIQLILITFGLLMGLSVEARPYIVGGRNITIDRIPYMASLGNCGASIIGPRHLLSAAHCFDDPDVHGGTVETGATKVGEGVKHQVIKVTVHPEYNWWPTLNNDFAVVTLAERITFNKKTQPIKLASENFQVRDGAKMIVAGWGAQDGKRLSLNDHYLKMTVVPKVNQKTCFLALKPNAKHIDDDELLTDSMLCAGYPQGGLDSCDGDSGGPLVFNGVQVGVVSWGFGCAKVRSPGVYSRVSTAYKWINSVMKETV